MSSGHMTSTVLQSLLVGKCPDIIVPKNLTMMRLICCFRKFISVADNECISTLSNFIRCSVQKVTRKLKVCAYHVQKLSMMSVLCCWPGFLHECDVVSVKTREFSIPTIPMSIMKSICINRKLELWCDESRCRIVSTIFFVTTFNSLVY